MPQIEKAVEQAKWVDKAKIQQRKFPGLLRSLTETSKIASEQLLNRDFERHFTEECKTLRAPAVTLQFPGRQGQVTRKKAVASGEHRPSDVLSEGFGSGIMGERLANGNVALALLANTVATGAALVALILTFGPISGAHLNPVVTIADAIEGSIRWPETPAYICAQIVGAIGGATTAHFMFGLPLFRFRVMSKRLGQVFSEFVATFGLAFRHLGLFPASIQRCPICCRRIHHSRLLVHRIYIVRESCRHDCAMS